jgi:hypothetical protein
MRIMLRQIGMNKIDIIELKSHPPRSSLAGGSKVSPLEGRLRGVNLTSIRLRQIGVNKIDIIEFVSA